MRRERRGVRKLHSVHMTCAAPPHPSKIFSLWDFFFFRVETLLNGDFKHESVDLAKYRVGGRGKLEQDHNHMTCMSCTFLETLPLPLRQIHLYL